MSEQQSQIRTIDQEATLLGLPIDLIVSDILQGKINIILVGESDTPYVLSSTYTGGYPIAELSQRQAAVKEWLENHVPTTAANEPTTKKPADEAKYGTKNTTLQSSYDTLDGGTYTISGVKNLSLRVGKNRCVFIFRQTINKIPLKVEFPPFLRSQAVDVAKVTQHLNSLRLLAKKLARKSNRDSDTNYKLKMELHRYWEIPPAAGTIREAVFIYFSQHLKIASPEKYKRWLRLFELYDQNGELTEVYDADIYSEFVRQEIHNFLLNREAHEAFSHKNSFIKLIRAATNYCNNNVPGKSAIPNFVYGIAEDKSETRETTPVAYTVVGETLTKMRAEQPNDPALNALYLSVAIQEKSLLRTANSISLNIADIKERACEIRVLPEQHKNRKTGKYFYPSQLSKILKEYLGGDNAFIFTNPQTQKPYANLSHVWSKVKKRAVEELKLVSAPEELIAEVAGFWRHDIRRVTYSLLLDTSASDVERKLLFNHYVSDVESAYARLSRDRKQKICDEKEALLDRARKKAREILAIDCDETVDIIAAGNVLVMSRFKA